MGKGNVLVIQAVYKTMTIEEEYIDDVDPGEKILIQRNAYYFTSKLISSSKTIDLSFISFGMRLSPLLTQT